VKIFKLGSSAFVLLLSLASANAQQRVPLTEPAVASDADGSPTIEGRLRTTSLNGAPDAPVTNIRFVLKNSSAVFVEYVSGVVTFYDSSGIRCGEGLYKADVLAPDESVETDTPGLRIRCSPATWRIVVTDLVPRTSTSIPPAESAMTPNNLRISVDGQEHPIQIDRPLVLTFGNVKRTIVVRRSQ
jgi:hypothetical protein